jgi:hypothetical protein
MEVNGKIFYLNGFSFRLRWLQLIKDPIAYTHNTPTYLKVKW